MSKMIAAALATTVAIAIASGQESSQRSPAIDSLIGVQQEYLYAITRVSQTVDSIRDLVGSVLQSSRSIEPTSVVIQESKRLRSDPSPDSKELMVIPSGSMVVLVDYRTEPVPSFRTVYGMHVGWLALQEIEVSKDVSQFVARVAANPPSYPVTPGTSDTLSQIMINAFTALMTFLVTIGTIQVKKRISQKKEAEQRSAKIWNGLETLRRAVRDKCQVPAMREQVQYLPHLNVETYAYLRRREVFEKFMAYFGRRFSSAGDALSECSEMQSLMTRLESEFTAYPPTRGETHDDEGQ